MATRAHAALVLLVSLLGLLSSAKLVVADIPSVVSFSANPIIDCGVPLAGRGFLLMVTIKHANPTASHYVDKIEILKEKTTATIDLQPQSGETFTTTAILCEGRDYQAGEELNVQVRAHCNVHGWGSWSSSITVPEFGAPVQVGLMTLLLAGVIVSSRRLIPRVRVFFRQFRG
jgi:desulfoferrodoxin (superoxide reductase-like protein)